MNWFKITKFFRGGKNEYQIRVPRVNLTKEDWDDLFNWLGENADGGHSYGFTIKALQLPRKSRKLKVVTYPSDVVAKLSRYGRKKTFITVQRMI